MPVHHCADSPSMLSPPTSETRKYVASAPAGAARLNTMRCTRAARFERPCFRRMEVNPKAAGALCTKMARKMISPTFKLDVVADAPIAMPSAAAWITRPVVVARLRVCFGDGLNEPRKPSDSSSPDVLGPARFSKLTCLFVGAVWNLSVAWRGSRSMRNISAKPMTRVKPIWNAGSSSCCFAGSPSLFNVPSASTARALCWCSECCEAAARASMPSGRMTIKQLPTSRPAPREEMSRSCAWESENDKGSAPARNELSRKRVSLRREI